MRVVTVPPPSVAWPAGGKEVRREDVFVLSGFCCAHNDFTLLERLRTELPEGREFSDWHGSRHQGIQFEGAGARHDDPGAPPALREAVARMEDAFGIRASASRLNCYRSNKDYKPLHYDRGRDSQGVPQMTVGASFGATRDLSFVHVASGVTTVFPQRNGDVFAFTPEINQVFMHGVPKVGCGRGRGASRSGWDAWQRDANGAGGDATGGTEEDGPRVSLIIWGSRVLPSDSEQAE